MTSQVMIHLPDALQNAGEFQRVPTLEAEGWLV